MVLSANPQPGQVVVMEVPSGPDCAGVRMMGKRDKSSMLVIIPNERAVGLLLRDLRGRWPSDMAYHRFRQQGVDRG